MKKSFGLALLLAAALSAAAVAAAPDKLEFNLGFTGLNECDTSLLVEAGDIAKVTFSYRNDGTIDVKFRYAAIGTDSGGGEYRVRWEGDATLASLAGAPPFRYSGSFIGKQGTPSFDVEGNVQVGELGGFPTVTVFAPDGYTCIGH